MRVSIIEAVRPETVTANLVNRPAVNHRNLIFQTTTTMACSVQVTWFGERGCRAVSIDRDWRHREPKHANSRRDHYNQARVLIRSLM